MDEIKYINLEADEFFSEDEDVYKGPFVIYKNMPFKNALKTLSNKGLWFANPSEWHDPYEKKFIESKYNVNGNNKDFLLKGKIFCTCLTQTAMSEAHWNQYSGGKIGIQFQIDRKKLLEVLKSKCKQYHVYIGKVLYLSTKDIEDVNICKSHLVDNTKDPMDKNEKWVRLLLLKRQAFEYENEIRIILIKKGNKISKEKKGITIKYSTKMNNIQHTDLFKVIKIDPNTDEIVSDYIKECVFVQKFKFPSKNIHISKLYKKVNTHSILTF